MKTATSLPSQLAVIGLLAPLLERLDRSTVAVGAEQYRSVVAHLAGELQALQSHPGLGAVLDMYPAAAELYENLNYEHAGLCRSELDASLRAEIQARDVLVKAASGTKAAPQR